MKKNKYKFHFMGESLRSLCGIIYPEKISHLLKYVDCKRCVATNKYKKERKINEFMKDFDKIDELKQEEQKNGKNP